MFDLETWDIVPNNGSDLWHWFYNEVVIHFETQPEKEIHNLIVLNERENVKSLVFICQWEIQQKFLHEHNQVQNMRQ
jgi:hypothetical protein